MGHVYEFDTRDIPDGESDQRWNHMQAEDPYHQFASSSASEQGDLRPMDNMQTDRVKYASAWVPPPRFIGHSLSGHSGASHNHSEVSGPNDSLHQLQTANVHMVLENHAHHASSSNHVVESCFSDLSMGNRRCSNKGKRPAIPPISYRSSTNRYYTRGCSSGSSSSVDSQQRRLNTDVQHTLLEPSNLSRSYHISGEDEISARNVRWRSSFELECGVFGANRSGNHAPHTNLTRHPLDCDAHRGTTVPLPEWDCVVLPTVPHVRTTVPDSKSVSHGRTQFFHGSSVSSISGQTDGYHHDPIHTRDPGVPQTSTATAARLFRSAGSSYFHGSNPARVSMENSRFRTAAPPYDGIPFAVSTYSSRHRRSVANAGWRFGDRGGRPRFSAERNRSRCVDAVRRYGSDPEALRIADHASLYASRHPFDQHRDMRLDIDNMSYEELLALGDMIGSVNTGISDDSLSKCLTETWFTSSDSAMEPRCSICLEEYQNMDQLAKIQACGHDFHGGCIKRWLSMKNSCPICKAAALPDEEK